MKKDDTRAVFLKESGAIHALPITAAKALVIESFEKARELGEVWLSFVSNGNETSLTIARDGTFTIVRKSLLPKASDHSARGPERAMETIVREIFNHPSWDVSKFHGMSPETDPNDPVFRT